MRKLAAAAAVVAVVVAAAAAAEPKGAELDALRMVLQALAGLAAVVGLVVLTRHAVVRLGGAASSKSVRLREVVRLSPQHALYVVEVDGRRLLLGQHVQVVCELPPAPEVRAGFADRLRMAARVPRGGAGEGRP